MPLAAGQTLSFYEILGPLGAGGMGEVWRARDTRLEREVAIKVLPEELADDEERLRRFEREAKTLAALNHPNVAHVYGIDQVDDTCFIAMELVPGYDLATRLAKGALPVDEAVDCCRQIAEGLEAAHESGVVHRDLKPANVRVTPDGLVKVLDFGLAKPIRPEPRGDGTSSADSDSFLVTEEGLVLGTPTYMSPEQARGKPVDRRTDVWAFGCVLYECLAGRRAFEGETFSDVLAAIVGSEPDWGALPRGIPRHVRALVARCLEKDARQRLRDVGEARIQLARGAAPPAEGAQEEPTQSALPLRVGLAGIALGVLVGGAAVWSWSGRESGAAADVPPRPRIELTIPGSTDLYREIAGLAMQASPDGTAVVFAATAREDDQRCLWVRELSSFEARRLPGTENARNPFWSPDGTAVGFFLRGTIQVLHLDEKAPRVLTHTTPGWLGYRGAAWSPTGVLVLPVQGGGGGLFCVDEAGGEPQQITTPNTELHESAHFSPHFLPDGDHFLYLAMVQEPDPDFLRHRLYVSSVSTGEGHLIAEFPSEAWYTERGELVYLEDGRIRSVPFDLETLHLAGEARTIVDGGFYIRVLGQGSMSAGRDGTLFFQGGGYNSVVWMSPRGLVLGEVVATHVMAPIRVSPDGGSVALIVADPRTAQLDVWIHGADRATSRRVTNTIHADFSPVWAPDGASLYFTYAAGEGQRINRIDADGRGQASIGWEAVVGGQAPLDVHPDGLLLATHGDELWAVPLEDPKQAELLAEGGRGRFSPDSRWIAYEATADRVQRTEVFLLDRESGGSPLQITVEGGRVPVWSPDGSKLYFLSGDNRLNEVELATDEQRSFPEARVLFETTRRIEDFDVDPDGSRFLMLLASAEGMPIQVLLRGD